MPSLMPSGRCGALLLLMTTECRTKINLRLAED